MGAPHEPSRRSRPARVLGALALAAAVAAAGGCDPYRAGRAALLAGDPARAAREIQPRDARGFLLRATAHLRAGDAEGAAADAAAALALRPRNRIEAESWAVAGQAERAAGRRGRALAAFARAEAVRPGCCGARPALAALLLERARERLAAGDAAGAGRDAAETARLDPGLAAEAAPLRRGVATAAVSPSCADGAAADAPACVALLERAPAEYARVALRRGWTISRPAAVRALLADASFAPGALDAVLDPGPALRDGAASAAPLAQAGLYRLAGRLAEARQALDRALAAAPDDPDQRRRIGVEALLLGDVTAADRHLRWAEALGGGGAATAPRALVLRLGGDAPAEWRYLHDAALTAPDPGAALFALGGALGARGDLGPAAAALAESAARGHRPAAAAQQQALDRLAVLWLTLERPAARPLRERLARAWGEVLGEPAGAALVRAIDGHLARLGPLGRARLRLAAGDPAGAAAALGATPDDGGCGPGAPFARLLGDEPAWLLRARVAQLRGEAGTLDRLLRQEIDRPAARSCRYPAAISLLAQAGRPADALRLARDLAAADPEYPPALLALARLELATGDDPGAALDLEAFVYHSADRGAALTETAAALAEAGRTREACVALRRALAVRGGAHRPTLLALGGCLARDRQAAAAAEVFARALRLSPPAELLASRREVARAWRAVGDAARAEAAAGGEGAIRVAEGAAVPAALRALEEAAPRRPLDPRLFVRRAALHAAAGEAQMALALLGRARAIRPDDPDVLVATARLLARIGGDGAEPTLLALALGDDPRVRCEADRGLATLYRAQGARTLAAAARWRVEACGGAAPREASPAPASQVARGR
jgi:tetratricopeptide (TPR) repeat protein